MTAARPHPVLRLARHLVIALALCLAAALHLPEAVARPGAPGGPEPVGVWPLLPEPEVVEGFDPPESAYGPGHRGVDLRGSPGQQVRAALAGRVSFAGVLAGVPMVTVDHGATRTTYQPVTPTAAVGDAVTAGDPVGRLGVVGSHCFPGACLHWGWIEGAETYLDPLRLVGGGPVRLLPLWRDEPVDAATALPRPPYASWRPVLRLFGALDQLPLRPGMSLLVGPA